CGRSLGDALRTGGFGRLDLAGRLSWRLFRSRRRLGRRFGCDLRWGRRYLRLEIQRRRNLARAVALRRRRRQLLALEDLTRGAAANHVGTESGLGGLL